MKLTCWTIVSPDLYPRSLCRCQTSHTAPEPAHLGNWHYSHFFHIFTGPMMISYIVAYSPSQWSWLTISQWRTLGHVDIRRSEKDKLQDFRDIWKLEIWNSKKFKFWKANNRCVPRESCLQTIPQLIHWIIDMGIHVLWNPCTLGLTQQNSDQTS